MKDSVAAPKTGWVFATLVYDASVAGDAWDRMVSLGAMWGNDPDVDSSRPSRPELNENWINPQAPEHVKRWSGRGIEIPDDPPAP